MNKKYKYILQTDTTDCGIASLITILLYYGIYTSKDEILSKINKANYGTTAYDLINVAKSYNLNAYGIKDKINNIKKLPVIAHTIKNNNMFHFIVIYEIDKIKRKIKIMDPDIGITNITFKKFNEISTDVFLIFDGKKNKLKNNRLKKEVTMILIDNKLLVIKTILVSILSIIFSLIFNNYLKLMLISNNLSYLVIIFVLFLVIVFFKNTINHVKNKFTLSLNISIDKNLNNRVLKHIFSLPYKYFISKTTGELHTLSEDIEIFKQIITNVILISAIDTIMIVIILFYLVFINSFAALILTIFSIIMILITNKYKYILNDIFIKLKKSKIRYSSLFIEKINAFESIKNLNLSYKIPNILFFNYNKKTSYEKNYINKELNYSFILNYFSDFFYIFCIFLISILSIKNNNSLYDIVLFSSVFYLYIGFLNNICENIYLYKIYEVSVNRVLDTLKIEKDKMTKCNMFKINKIDFKKVKVKLNNKTIFSDIDISLYKNDKVHLSGRSGIGKTILMKTLIKNNEITDGNIFIDNINLKDLDLSFIKENITYIGQNETLFKGSIKDNLDLISYDTKLQDKVLKIALFDKVLDSKKTDKNYLLEESAKNLSGGEKKKLILARGLLHFKEVLILDEVFNEISVVEERIILNNIFKNYKDKIIIVISHRNSNIDLFNKKLEIGDDGIYEII